MFKLYYSTTIRCYARSVFGKRFVLQRENAEGRTIVPVNSLVKSFWLVCQMTKTEHQSSETRLIRALIGGNNMTGI